MAAPERPKGLLGWLRFLGEPSVRAAPYQMVFISGFVVALGLTLVVVTFFFDSRIPVLGLSPGLLLLGALGIYGGLHRIKNDAKTR